MELIKGSFFIEWSKVDTSLRMELVSLYANVGKERKNGFEVLMQPHEGLWLLNPLDPKICDTTGIMAKVKPKVLIEIGEGEYVMGVAGKEIMPLALGSPFLSKRYWIVEKFVRMEYDDFSYRIFKHSVQKDTTFEPFGFFLDEKELFESNWDSYPRNIVLKRMVSKIEGMLIARG